jgi:hypothetical protein
VQPRPRGYLIAAVLAGLLALLVLDMPRSREQDFRAARYTQIVDALYLNSHIIAIDDSDAGAGGGSGAQITYRKPADATQARLADWYYKNSYLKGDVQRFNDGSPEGRLLFDLQHDQLAHVNPAAHLFRPSLGSHGRWLGKLLYADGGRGMSLTLASLDEGATIGVDPLAHPFVQEPQSRHGYVSLFGRTPAPMRGGSIIHFTTADHHEIAHVWAMGDGALLRLVSPEPESHVEIRIDGRALHGTGGEVYALGRDSVLLFENHRAQARSGRRRERRSSAWIVRDEVAPDVAYDGRNGLWQRTPYDPLLPRVQSLLAEVAASGPRDVDADVRLTLSRSAEEEAGGILEAALARNGGPPSSAPAAITLMDGLSGNLLALPSWPEGPATQAAAAQLSVAEENQNFTRHSIGSVAKVLFAPAVLDTHPDLLRLALPAWGEGKDFNTVLGLPLNRDVQDDALARNYLDFTAAVALSSNRYAVTLLTLGSDDPRMTAQGSQEIPDVADRYYLDGRLVDHRPAGLIFNPGTPDSLSVLGLTWVERMRHLLDVNVATAADRVSRQYIWDGLPAQLQPRLRQRRMLDSISPEYENLRMEAIRNRREDFGSKFASLTLGAGESRWTNVALAEAVATLIENRPVRAQLVVPADGVVDSEGSGTPSYDFRRLGQPAHQALGDAMAAVAHFGTAAVLDSMRAELARAACTRHEAFALFAKTGTPVLTEQHESPEAGLFNQMARAQLFRRNAAGQILYTGFSSGSPEGRVVTYRDLATLRQLRDQGTGPVAEHFSNYFLPKSQSATVKADIHDCHEDSSATPRVLWSRVMRIVAESNEAPGYAPIRSDGPVLSYTHMCTATKSESSHNINGRHIVMLAATYPREAVMGGGTTDCQGAAPHIDVGHRPTHAVVAVVAIADPERMDRTLDVARKLLAGPMAEHLGLTPIPAPAPVPASEPQEDDPQ